MTDDILDEEQQIASEQDSAGFTLSSDTFKEPLSNMDTPSVLCLEESATIGEAVKMMQNRKIGSIVITKDKKLTGIITERDILMKVIGVLSDWEKVSVTQVMTPNPESLMADDMIAFVLNNMHVGGYRHVPIVNDKDEPVTMISIKDVVSFVLDHFPEDINNITSTPFRGEKSREGAQ